MVRWVKVVALCTLLAGCGAVNPLKLLGGGPNLAANVQAGKTNSQTIGSTSITEQKLVQPRARTITQTADKNGIRGETVTVNQAGISPWYVLAFVAWSWFLYELPAPRHVRKWMEEKWKS